MPRTKPFASDAEIRAALEHALGTPLSDDQWVVLDETGEVGVFRMGAITIPEWAKKVRTVQRAFGGGTPTAARSSQARSELLPRAPQGARPGFYTRHEALCLALQGLAAKEPEVVAFRREVLADRMLTYGLDTDLDADDDEEDAARTREDVALWFPRQIARERAQLGGFAGEPPRLRYLRFLPGPIEETPVAPGGVLDRLRRLGDYLAARYRWQPHVAVAWVLSTEVSPNVAEMRATIQPHHAFPALTRIVLTVDPAETPTTVAQLYREARAHLTRNRAREMHDKALALAVFAAGRPAKESVKKQLAEWNRAAPEPKWGYEPEQIANYVRDRNAALQRLVRPAYRLPESEETWDYDDYFAGPDARVYADQDNDEDQETADEDDRGGNEAGGDGEANEDATERPSWER